MIGATIHFLAVLANLVQVAVEIGVVSCGAEPAHQWVFPRYVHVHERARVQLLPEQRAETLHGFFARRRRRMDIGKTQELSGELSPWLRTDLDETG
jgi:hypothetical protein